MIIKVKVYMKSGTVIEAEHETSQKTYGDILREIIPQEYSGSFWSFLKRKNEPNNGNVVVLVNEIEAIEVFS